MKLNFLFWNINKNDCTTEVKNLVQTNEIDILILAESRLNPSSLLLTLNSKSTSFFPMHPRSQCEKLAIYTKFSYDFIEPVKENGRITGRNLKLPIIENLNLIALHLGDKGNNNEESQSEIASKTKKFIDEMEIKQGHQRTIVVGDFNMNPFEVGIIKANGFHATMSSKLSKQLSRTIQSEEYPYFYNPMWNLFGDMHNKICGSYYYRRAELVNFGWNIFDQVLLRPALIDNLDNNSIQILFSDGEKDLITKEGIPNQKYSDHLPITFSLNF